MENLQLLKDDRVDLALLGRAGGRPPGAVAAVSQDPVQGRLVVLQETGTVLVLSTGTKPPFRTGQVSWTVQLPPVSGPWRFLFALPGSDDALCVAGSGEIATLPVREGDESAATLVGTIEGGVAGAALSSGGELLSLATASGNLLVLTTGSWEVIAEVPSPSIPAPLSPVHLAWRPDGAFLASLAVDEESDAAHAHHLLRTSDGPILPDPSDDTPTAASALFRVVDTSTSAPCATDGPALAPSTGGASDLDVHDAPDSIDTSDPLAHTGSLFRRPPPPKLPHEAAAPPSSAARGSTLRVWSQTLGLHGTGRHEDGRPLHGVHCGGSPVQFAASRRRGGSTLTPWAASAASPAGAAPMDWHPSGALLATGRSGGAAGGSGAATGSDGDGRGGDAWVQVMERNGLAHGGFPVAVGLGGPSPLAGRRISHLAYSPDGSCLAVVSGPSEATAEPGGAWSVLQIYRCDNGAWRCCREQRVSTFGETDARCWGSRIACIKWDPESTAPGRLFVVTEDLVEGTTGTPVWVPRSLWVWELVWRTAVGVGATLPCATVVGPTVHVTPLSGGSSRGQWPLVPPPLSWGSLRLPCNVSEASWCCHTEGLHDGESLLAMLLCDEHSTLAVAAAKPMHPTSPEARVGRTLGLATGAPESPAVTLAASQINPKFTVAGTGGDCYRSIPGTVAGLPLRELLARASWEGGSPLSSRILSLRQLVWLEPAKDTVSLAAVGRWEALEQDTIVVLRVALRASNASATTPGGPSLVAPVIELGRAVCHVYPAPAEAGAVLVLTSTAGVLSPPGSWSHGGDLVVHASDCSLWTLSLSSAEWSRVLGLPALCSQAALVSIPARILQQGPLAPVYVGLSCPPAPRRVWVFDQLLCPAATSMCVMAHPAPLASGPLLYTAPTPAPGIGTSLFAASLHTLALLAASADEGREEGDFRWGSVSLAGTTVARALSMSANHDSRAHRPVEIGGVLVGADCESSRAVLQAPRGSLEAVAPRALTSSRVRALLSQGRLAEAVEWAWGHRVDLNLIVDHDARAFARPGALEAAVRSGVSHERWEGLLSSLEPGYVGSRRYPQREAREGSDSAWGGDPRLWYQVVGLGHGPPAKADLTTESGLLSALAAPWAVGSSEDRRAAAQRRFGMGWTDCKVNRVAHRLRVALLRSFPHVRTMLDIRVPTSALGALPEELRDAKAMLSLLATLALQSPPSLAAALSLVRTVAHREAELAPGAPALVTSSDQCLKYLARISPGGMLAEAAVGQYDPVLAAAVAAIEGRDPQQYELPLARLQRLRETSTSPAAPALVRAVAGARLRLAVDVPLGRWTRVIKSLSVLAVLSPSSRSWLGRGGVVTVDAPEHVLVHTSPSTPRGGISPAEEWAELVREAHDAVEALATTDDADTAMERELAAAPWEGLFRVAAEQGLWQETVSVLEDVSGSVKCMTVLEPGDVEAASPLTVGGCADATWETRVRLALDVARCGDALRQLETEGKVDECDRRVARWLVTRRKHLAADAAEGEVAHAGERDTVWWEVMDEEEDDAAFRQEIDRDFRSQPGKSEKAKRGQVKDAGLLSHSAAPLTAFTGAEMTAQGLACEPVGWKASVVRVRARLWRLLARDGALATDWSGGQHAVDAAAIAAVGRARRHAIAARLGLRTAGGGGDAVALWSGCRTLQESVRLLLRTSPPAVLEAATLAASYAEAVGADLFMGLAACSCPSSRLGAVVSERREPWLRNLARAAATALASADDASSRLLELRMSALDPPVSSEHAAWEARCAAAAQDLPESTSPAVRELAHWAMDTAATSHARVGRGEWQAVEEPELRWAFGAGRKAAARLLAERDTDSAVVMLCGAPLDECFSPVRKAWAWLELLSTGAATVIEALADAPGDDTDDEDIGGIFGGRGGGFQGDEEDEFVGGGGGGPHEALGHWMEAVATASKWKRSDLVETVIASRISRAASLWTSTLVSDAREYPVRLAALQRVREARDAMSDAERWGIAVQQRVDEGMDADTASDAGWDTASVASSVAASVASLGSLGGAAVSKSSGSVASRILHASAAAGAVSVAASLVNETHGAESARVSSGAFSHHGTLALGGDIFGRAGRVGHGDPSRGQGAARFLRAQAAEQEQLLKEHTKRRDKSNKAAHKGRVVANSVEDEAEKEQALSRCVPLPLHMAAVRAINGALLALRRVAEADRVSRAAADLAALVATAPPLPGRAALSKRDPERLRRTPEPRAVLAWSAVEDGLGAGGLVTDFDGWGGTLPVWAAPVQWAESLPFRRGAEPAPVRGLESLGLDMEPPV
jgi:hypothetical protein